MRAQKTYFGIKQMSLENLLEPDQASPYFEKVSTVDGHTQQMHGKDWLVHILEPALSDTVNKEVQKLFEVARGTMGYGYFFFPLYTLGTEQLFRVCEAAVSLKCKSLNASKKTNTFSKKLKFLLENDAIQQTDYNIWDKVVRALRNSASHPKSQTILAPGQAIRILSSVADLINSLFNYHGAYSKDVID